MAAKHSMHTSIHAYEQILKRAWETTKTHWELWFLGIFAGLAYSGSVLQNVLQQLLRVRPADQIMIADIEHMVPGATFLISYGRSLITLPAGRLSLTIFSLVILIAAFLLAAVAAQHALLASLHRASRRKKRIPLHTLMHEAEHVHFARLFAVNASIFLLTNIVVLSSSIPLSLLLQEQIGTDTLVYLGLYTLLLPTLFVINILGMFALVHIVRLNDGIDKAARRAASVVRRHWLVAFEQACVVLGVNIFAFVCYLAFIIAIILLAAPFFFIALSLGSAPLMASVGFVGFIVIALGFVLFFGMLTTFNYAVWTELTERLERFTLIPAFEGFMRKFKR